jgi:hypothetical protein
MSHNAKIPGSVLLFTCGPFVAMKITEALPIEKYVMSIVFSIMGRLGHSRILKLVLRMSEWNPQNHWSITDQVGKQRTSKLVSLIA